MSKHTGTAPPAAHDTTLADLPEEQPAANHDSALSSLSAVASMPSPVQDEETVDTPLPLANFSPSLSKGCAPVTVRFTNFSENSAAWQWNFGDGASSKEKDPEHRYENPGTYTVTLTVTASGGRSSLQTATVKVYPVPEVQFDTEVHASAGEEQPVYFYNRTTGAERYRWDFGDGSASEQKEPVHYYRRGGTYDITLVARNAGGCSDSLTIADALAGDDPGITFPNAFTPDMNGPTGGYYNSGEGNHAVFHPYTEVVPEEYRLRIFNRRGMMLFESTDLSTGWDGYYNGTLQPRGVYIWKARGRFPGGKTFEKMGDVTLIYNQHR